MFAGTAEAGISAGTTLPAFTGLNQVLVEHFIAPGVLYGFNNNSAAMGYVSVTNGLGTATANSDMVPNPTVYARADTGGDVNGIDTAVATLNYNVEVAGPYSPTLVPVWFAASYAESGIGGSFGISITPTPVGEVWSGSVVGRDLVGSITAELQMTPTFMYTVHIGAGASVNGSNAFNPAVAFASVDPVFTVDPAYAGQYSIVFSPGVGNSPDVVPEPAGWTMMLAGLGGLGMARRFRWRQLPGRAPLPPDDLA